MVASELVKAGFSVIILEKGGYYTAEDFKRWRETEAMASAFERGGLCTTSGIQK